MTKQTRYSPEVRDRAVRMVSEQEGAHSPQWAAIESVFEDRLYAGDAASLGTAG